MSDHTRAELERIVALETRYRRLVENGSDMVAECDADGRFLFASPNSASMLGFPANELVGRHFSDPEILKSLHPDYHQTLVEFFQARREGSDATMRYRFRRADGTWGWFESRGRLIRTPDDETHWVLFTRDVSDREEALRRLQISEERYRILSETTLDLVAELDSEGKLVFMSTSAEEVLGYRPEELIGTTPFSLVHADDIEHLAELFLNRLTSSHRPRHQQVFRIHHRDGTLRWLQGGGVNFTASDGETRVVAVMRDVTERLREADERRRLEERVQQAQKLESLAMMASGVAHDFNNLLTPILGDASLALMDLPADSPLRDHLEKIQRAAHHASTLTNQLLDYAGIGSLHTEPLDLSKLVLEMGELLQSAVSKNALISYDLASDLRPTEGDAAQVNQVLLNLITNASEAIEAKGAGRGRIHVRTGAVEADRALLSGLFLGEEISPGVYVWVEVEDSGVGMEQETEQRVFDPFFTTKFTGRGLGLAAVLGIVRKHGGAIEIDSERGRGARIRVLLPSAMRRAVHPVAAPPEPSDWIASGKLLVADDDEGVRDLLAVTLGRAGFEVIEAADGNSAVERFRSDPDAIRLVLLDRTMPGGTGEDAFDEIRRIRPDVPILLVSGYSQENIAERFTNAEFDGFIQKPFIPARLVEKVRELLGD